MPKVLTEEERKEREADIQKYLDQGYSEHSAKEMYYALHSKAAVNIEIQKIMEEYNCGYSRAKYIYGLRKKNLPYNPRKHYCKGLKFEDIKDYHLKKDPEHPSGWALTRNDNPISLYKKDAHWYIQKYIGYKNGKNIIQWIPLASIVYINYKLKEVPAGYCIDHLDGDPNNNNINNLQLVSDSENKRLGRRRTNKGSNQWGK